MAGLINDLMDKLRIMADSLEALSDFALKKKEAILQNDVDAVKDITARENSLVGKYQKAERAAGGIMEDVASVLNQNPGELTLGRLGEIIKEQSDYAEFMAVYERLKNSSAELKQRNDINNSLIESVLDYISYTVNAIRTTQGISEEGVLDTKN